VELLSKYIGLFSGGKDSLTACHYLWNRDKLDEVLYCKTGIGLDENVDYVIKTCDKYNWKLNIVEPKENESYEDFIRKFGFPHQGMHSAIMGYLKWHPLRKFARGKDIIYVSGRRRKESKRRMGKVKGMYETTENIRFYAPLIDWSDKQVWDYIKEENLDLCPVYKTLHMSGDCLCGAFSELGESELISTFHPYMADRIRNLELKYKEQWGNNSSMIGALKQDKIVNYICGECSILNGNEKET
jgi:3''-phosphoadenosine 5''-phosphosulfate sulfotransferase (PAPS reductase)/FAD synthetase and related enzymes